MKPVKNRFSDVEYWLDFLKKWDLESNEPVPEQAIISLEVAVDKLLYDYNHQNSKNNPSQLSIH